MPVPAESPVVGIIAEHVDVKVLLAGIVESTTDLVWAVDPERFGMLAANRALCAHLRRLTGRDLRPGTTPDDILTPAVAARMKEFYARALREGACAFEYESALGGGLLLELHLTRMERDGVTTGIAVVGRDITERRRAAEQLRKRESFFRALQCESPDLSAVIGADHVVRYVSPACIPMLGYSCEELLALGPLDLVHSEDRPRVARGLAEVLAKDGRVVRGRYRVRHRDGTWRHLETVARNQVANADVGGVILNTRDVTEQVKLASRLEHVREEEKARIARDLHDELGQALTGLKLELLSLEEALEALPPGPQVNALVERAVAASELAASAIASVQQIATELHPAALDRLGLAAALRQEARAFEGRTGISVHVELAADLPPLRSQPATALYRIAQEALTNVARHARARHVNLRLAAGPEGIALTIEDDGVGIEPGRAHDAASLGLAGMRERAELEGGEVEVSARTTGGTRVAARLPVAAMEEAS